jgi:predicted dehydrogenase
MTSTRPRIGLVGCGIIAESRVPALRHAGLEVAAVASRPESSRLHAFAEKHHIGKVLPDWRLLVEDRSLWDGLVVSTWPDGTPEVLETVLRRHPDAAILVEKPVAWNTDRHNRLCALPHEKVMVGYNRRFYDSVQRARREVLAGPPVVAQLVLPTDVVAPARYDATGSFMLQFYESVSALGLDLTRFVLGDLAVEHVERLHTPEGNLRGLAALLSTATGGRLQVTANWSAPANYALSLSWPGRRYELLPFEIGTLYEGLEVVPPSPDYPIRRYTPKPIERVALSGDDLAQKPGFVAEARAFAELIAGVRRSPFAAGLEDARAVTALCESLTGVKLTDRNPSPYHHHR